MATYGKISEFEPDSEDWLQYVERLGYYFEANEISDAAKQKAIFLSVCGSKSYSLLRDLIQPRKPTDLTFVQLTTVLTNHFKPKPSVIVQRFKFHSKVRKEGQTVSVFVAELRRLTEFCAFGASLDDMIRDRLVCGINDDRIQRRLLSESDLTLQRAVELATAMETAAKDVLELQQQSKAESTVNIIQSSASKTVGTFGCFRCGGKHSVETC